MLRMLNCSTWRMGKEVKCVTGACSTTDKQIYYPFHTMPVNYHVYILPAQKADNYIIIVDYTAIFRYALIPFSPLTVMDCRLACGSKGRHLTDKQDKSSKTFHMNRKCLPRSNLLMQYSTISLQYAAQPLAPGEKSQNKSGKYLPCKDHFSAIFHFVSLNFGHKEY